MGEHKYCGCVSNLHLLWFAVMGVNAYMIYY